MVVICSNYCVIGDVWFLFLSRISVQNAYLDEKEDACFALGQLAVNSRSVRRPLSFGRMSLCKCFGVAHLINKCCRVVMTLLLFIVALTLTSAFVMLIAVWQ